MSSLGDSIESIGGLHGLALKVDDCAPAGSENTVSMEFKMSGDKFSVGIKTTKSGGRTYLTEAAIDPDDLAKIIHALTS